MTNSRSKKPKAAVMVLLRHTVSDSGSPRWRVAMPSTHDPRQGEDLEQTCCVFMNQLSQAGSTRTFVFPPITTTKWSLASLIRTNLAGMP